MADVIIAYKYYRSEQIYHFLKMPVNLFVKSAANKTINIIIHDSKWPTTTLLGLKQLIKDKNGIPPEVPPEHQILIVGNEQLREDTKLLQDYDSIKNNCTIFAVIRVPGGQDECLTCCNIKTLLKTPCKCEKAIYCAECIIRDVKTKVDYRSAKLVCPYCTEEWNLIEIQKTTGMGAFSDAEFNEVTKKLAQNYINSEPGIRECPGCHTYCIRQDQKKNRFYCYVCAKQNKKAEYCFQCSLPWKKPSSHVDCGNPNCESADPLSLLAVALKKQIGTMKDCPSLRMCPGCATIIEHKERCKQMNCKNCNTHFCFACLTIGKYKCGSACAVAPVQTEIPSTIKKSRGNSTSYRCLANL